MSSTISEIKKLRQRLDKLRAELIKEADDFERRRIERQMEHTAKTLAMLEG